MRILHELMGGRDVFSEKRNEARPNFPDSVNKVVKGCFRPVDVGVRTLKVWCKNG